ncbi:MAG: hypothetical protein IT495_10385 [Gammaproteobacteria bacterium]|nr:hypothetical protein [Gammaproteobacteria bacterium]
MTTVQVTLPDQLAREAQAAGLLTPEELERLVRDALRARRLQAFAEAGKKLTADPLPSMTAGEIQAEIDAYRAESRRAAGA